MNSITHRSRIARRPALWIALLAIAAFAAPATAGERERAKIRSDFASTGVDADASGEARGEFRADRAKIRLRFEGLDSGGDYTVALGGEPIVDLTADSDGRARFRLRTRNRRDPMGFDPRGKEVSLRDSEDRDVLVLVFSGPGENDGIRVDERTRLDATELSDGGRARARFRIKKDGRRRFEVKLNGVDPGPYDVFVDGDAVGSIDVDDSDREGKVRFESDDDGDDEPLDFDPRGKVVDVADEDGDVVFSDDFESDAGGVNDCRERELETFLDRTDAAAGGKGRARWELDDDCETKFDVEIEDVPEGDYTLLVDGVDRGTIRVTRDDDGELEGEIEFENDDESDDDGDDDSDELPLDFDVLDLPIEVVQGETLFFSGVLSSDATRDGDDDGDDDDDRCAESETELPMLAVDAPAGSKAEVEVELDDDCEEELKVEVEDLPEGDLDLFVGDVLRGTFSVVRDDDGDLEGEIEFSTDSDDDDELPLDFEFRGELVQVVRDGVVLFERTLPE